MHQPPHLLQMLHELIALPSVSSVNPRFDSGNRAVIDRLAEWLEGFGFAIDIQPLPEHPDKANLIATLGEGDGGLVLAGHTDTVPYDESRWQSDPFTLTERDQRLYGLGTSDMKGFFALAIEAARGLSANSLQQPLIIIATADEESSMDGAKQLVAQGRPRARYAVIGEPTNLRPVNAHKGIMMEAVHLLGRAGHSSDPELGISALEGMHRVMAALLEWRETLQREHRDERFRVPMPTMNLGHIHGGDNPNRICGECELHIDLRPVPGLSLSDLRRDLARVVEQAVAGSELIATVSPLFDGVDALYTPPTSPIVAVVEELTGHPSETVAFATEGPFFDSLGIDTVILGPGNIAQAHQPDEYLAIDRLQPTIELLQGLIDQFCVRGER